MNMRMISQVQNLLLMFRYSEKATKISHIVLMLMSNFKKKGGRVFKFCGLLTISELHHTNSKTGFFLKFYTKNHWNHRILTKQLCITNIPSIRGKGGQILHHDCAQCKCCHDTHCTMIYFPKISSDDNKAKLFQVSIFS